MSATLIGTVRGYFALGNVKAGILPVLNSARGFSGVSPNGPGDYTLTLQDGLTLNADGGGIALVQVYGSTPGESAIEQVDATHLRVRTIDNAGAPLDADFGIAIQDVGPS